jgi:predicted porin
MKKSLLALAALAAVSGTAFAQSSVTIYGRVALGVEKFSDAPAKIDAQNGISQLGFKGTEDLGGGLKAYFDIRHRFSPESGSNDGSTNRRVFWQSVSKVGLSGSFGSVDIGRQLTALQGPINLSDPWATENVASVANLPAGYSTDRSQPDNGGLGRTDVIAYNTPNLSGFSGTVNYAPRRTAVVPGGTACTTLATPNPNLPTCTPFTIGAPAGSPGITSGGAVTRANNFYSLWAQYAAGPIFAGAGAERNREGDKSRAILGSYDFGVAKIMAGYGTVDLLALAGPTGKNWNAGVTAPFGAMLFKVGYSRSKAEGTEIVTKKGSAGVEYNLSKRTYLYTSGTKFTQVSTTAAKTAFDVGISHSF